MSENIVIVGHDLKFISDFISYLSQSQSAGWVKVFSYKGHSFNKTSVDPNAIEVCDIIFCEWALGNALHFSKFKPQGKRLVVRLHAQELRILKSEYLDKINWSNVDAVIVISPAIKEKLILYYPDLTGKVFFVPNYVPERKIGLGNRSIVPQYHLGMLGYVPALKRVDLALELLARLRQNDPRYSLSIKGVAPRNYSWMKARRGEMEWYDRIFNKYQILLREGGVVYSDISDNVASWYESVGIILSVSDSEGSHQSVAEGMASGCVQVIRDWEGAYEIYGGPVFETIDEMAEYIFTLRAEEVFWSLSTHAKEKALTQFHPDKVFKQLVAVIFGYVE